jgi:hypothetical protein
MFFHGTFFISTQRLLFLLFTATANFSYFLMNLFIASSTVPFGVYAEVAIALR